MCGIDLKEFTFFYKPIHEKSRIRETKNLSTDTDSKTDTILERLRDLSKEHIYIFFERLRDFSHYYFFFFLGYFFQKKKIYQEVA